MRTELKLILWVTAVLALLSALFHVTASSPSVNGEGAKASLNAVIEPVVVAGGSVASAPPQSADLPPIPTDELHLFPVQAVAGPVPVAVAPAAPAVLPMLKGIVSSGGQPKAIFANGGSGSAYVTVGVGDSVQGFSVREVGGDFVVLASESGQLSTLRVRGVGEAP